VQQQVKDMKTFPIALQGAHSCVPNCLHYQCQACGEYMFDSLKVTTSLPGCGHMVHEECSKHG
jgi:hypothetical protein